jgi:two-component system, chemotaxis family, sensor kinase CheA
MGEQEALHKELLEIFRLEAQDHLGALSTLLVALENERDSDVCTLLVESIFRRMHTLKGAAHAVNLIEVAQNCQEVENLLADLKRGEIGLELPLFDRLHARIDELSQAICAWEEDGAPSGVRTTPDAGDAMLPGAGKSAPIHASGEPAKAEAIQGPEAAAPPSPSALDAAQPGTGGDKAYQQERGAQNGRSPADDTVRVSTRLLESLLLQSEELVSAKLSATMLAEELAEAAAELSGRGNDRMRALALARQALRKSQPQAREARLAGLVEEIAQAERQTEGRLRQLEKGAVKHLRSLQGMVDPLLDDMKKLHLLPFSFLTTPFAKLVRDLARELDKEAELYCFGGEIELDRRILAELKEPLLHIVRNVMDHGLEKPAERRLQGKPGKGKISISIRLQDANLAEIVVADDGRGIDLAQVKAAALRQELAAPEALERMADAEALQLVFESGISTSRIITGLSGRGVGLAIVRESLEKLGGHATVESGPGAGTRFRLCLPLSFAMMRGLLVETAGRSCMLPAANVELTARVPLEQIRSLENRDTVLLAGEVVSLASLSRILELRQGAAENPSGFQAMVLLNAGDKRIAFSVDQVVGVLEILVKPLGSQLSRVRNVAGATVLGTGLVVPVLNVGDLFRSALNAGSSGLAQAPSPARHTPRRRSVLVAEDSITSRTLLKNLLESSGFLVQTAIDGADALCLLKTESFDIVVSDVEMPRLDGFGLTAAIRADGRLASIPVVLVTGLESRADRERGIEVGANAYIVKSSFDQSSLVEVILKLT